MNRDIELLNRGILPDSLNFNSDKNHEFVGNRNEDGYTKCPFHMC